MTDLIRYAAELAGAPSRPLPPVDRWAPAYCGELDLVIRRDGVWVHEGTPIARAALVRLFSTVLRKEDDRYFLVTPAEKLGLKVEDAPFLAINLRTEPSTSGPALVFTTNVGDEVVAGDSHRLDFRGAPYLHVRAGLEALVARAVYYDLVALGETREIDGERHFGVASCGAFFSFGLAAAIMNDGIAAGGSGG